jgi:hypothetical protein
VHAGAVSGKTNDVGGMPGAVLDIDTEAPGEPQTCMLAAEPGHTGSHPAIDTVTVGFAMIIMVKVTKSETPQGLVTVNTTVMGVAGGVGIVEGST